MGGKGIVLIEVFGVLYGIKELKDTVARVITETSKNDPQKVIDWMYEIIDGHEDGDIEGILSQVLAEAEGLA